MTAPNVIVLGGPNGSGKSTAAVRLLRDELQVMEFVNADRIAQGLSAFQPDRHAIEAGRIMLGQLERLAEQNENFAFETTLSSRTFAPWLQKLKCERNYDVRLVYFWLPSVEVNIQRVAARVALGGHAVPEETIRRRYQRSIQNLFDLYLPLADRWEIYDNTDLSVPTIVASGNRADDQIIHDESLWALLRSHHDA